MGQRANLITVENGDYTLRYDHWVANRLDEILFWGADYALEYIEAQEIVGQEGWLDEIWAEGGAVLDLDKKQLLWWGGQDVNYELPLRRAFLKMQQKVWDGWTIEWANRGIVDLAEYVGYPKEKVLSSREDLSSAVELEIAERKSWIRTIGSFKGLDGGIKLFPLNFETEDYLRNGLELVRQCKSAIGLDKLNWQEWSEDEEFPHGGFWIDEKTETVEFWQVRDYPNVIQELKSLWEDWELIWHQDNCEFQFEKLEERLLLPQIDEEELIKGLRESLLRDDGRLGIESVLDASNILKNEGKSVQINPWMYKSHHVKKPLESKLEIWQRVFGEK